MASDPISSWQIDGETMEIVRDFIYLGSQITADSYCSHEIKRCLFLRRKAMTNLESILKSRDIALPTKDYLVKAMVFPVVTKGHCPGFPGGSAGKESACNVGDWVQSLGWEDPLGKGKVTHTSTSQ